MLTNHQRLHLDAMLTEMVDNKKQDVATRRKLAKAKGVNLSGYEGYLDGVKIKVQNIISSGVFPEWLEPSDIHDYLEKL